MRRLWVGAICALTASCVDPDSDTTSETRATEVDESEPVESEQPMSADTGEGIREFPPPTLSLRDEAATAAIFAEREQYIRSRSHLPTWLAQFQEDGTTTVLAEFVVLEGATADGRTALAQWRVVEHLRGPSIPQLFTLSQSAEDGEIPSCNSVRGRAGRVDLLIVSQEGEAYTPVVRNSQVAFAIRSDTSKFRWEMGPTFSEDELRSEASKW